MIYFTIYGINNYDRFHMINISRNVPVKELVEITSGFWDLAKISYKSLVKMKITGQFWLSPKNHCLVIFF